MLATDTKRVMGIVEDQADIRALLRLVLSSDTRIELAGEATSAEEALELAEQWRPDMIILDQSLDGELTGTQSAPMFKAILPNVKILLFSAYDIREEAEANDAIDEFLRKDSFPDLFPTVLRMLELAPQTSDD